MKTKLPDPYKGLSHVYANPKGDDAGQEEFDRLPEGIVNHLMRAFAHAAGVGPDPGKLKRPRKRKKP